MHRPSIYAAAPVLAAISPAAVTIEVIIKLLSFNISPAMVPPIKIINAIALLSVHSKLAVLFIICAIVAGVCIYLITISDVAFLWALVPLVGFAVHGAVPITFALAMEIEEVGTKYGGTAMGMLVAFQAAGGFLLPSIGGQIAEINRSWPFVFWATFVLVALLCAFMIKEPSRKRITK